MRSFLMVIYAASRNTLIQRERNIFSFPLAGVLGECWCVCYLLSGRYITVYHMSTFVTYDFEIDCRSEKEFF